MYSSYDEASRSLVDELGKVCVLTPHKRAYLRSVLARALLVDTNHTLTRTDFLSPNVIMRALKNEPGDTSIVEDIRIIFPRTWKVMENCK